MELLRHLFHALFPLTQEKLNDFIGFVGIAPFYGIICAILFCETGLVVTPFLPGDSLLFTLGAIGAHPNAPFHLLTIGPVLVAAALLGDNTNYWIGYRLGPAMFSREHSLLLNKKYLLRAHEFDEKYGPKMIVLARFVPIIRTFAPFVAGIGKMSYPKFLAYSITGAIAWVTLCLAAGRAFGTLDIVKKHFDLVLVAIVLISVLPMVIEILRARSHGKGFEPIMDPNGRH